ncbi:hypothetical protein CHUAL_002963 [Chamberlinius hualienensis]
MFEKEMSPQTSTSSLNPKETFKRSVTHHAYAKCVSIPLWPTDMTSETIWKEADFTGTFLGTTIRAAETPTYAISKRRDISR